MIVPDYRWAKIDKDMNNYANKKLRDVYGTDAFELDTEQHEVWLKAFNERSIQLGNGRKRDNEERACAY